MTQSMECMGTAMSSIGIVIYTHKRLGVLQTCVDLWSAVTNDIAIYTVDDIKDEYDRDLSKYGHVSYVSRLCSVNANGSGYLETIADMSAKVSADYTIADYTIFVHSDVWLISPKRFNASLNSFIESGKQFCSYNTIVEGQNRYTLPATDFFVVDKSGLQTLTKEWIESTYNTNQELLNVRQPISHINAYDPFCFECLWEKRIGNLTRYIIGDHPYHQYGYKPFGIGHFHDSATRMHYLALSNSETGKCVAYDPDPVSIENNYNGDAESNKYKYYLTDDLDHDFHTDFIL